VLSGFCFKSDFTYDFIYIFYTVAHAPVGNPVDNFHAYRRIYEVGGANLYCQGSGKHELYGIAAGGYAAKSDDRNLYGFSRLPHHAHGDGAHCRA